MRMDLLDHFADVLPKNDSFKLKQFKVRIPGERFWIHVLGSDKRYVYGTVANDLINGLPENKWCQFGNLVKWNRSTGKITPYKWIKKNTIQIDLMTLEVPIGHNMIARWVPINNNDDSNAKCQCCGKDAFQFAAPVCKEHYIFGGYDRAALGKKAVDELNTYINENPILDLDPIVYKHDC